MEEAAKASGLDEPGTVDGGPGGGGRAGHPQPHRAARLSYAGGVDRDQSARSSEVPGIRDYGGLSAAMADRVVVPGYQNVDGNGAPARTESGDCDQGTACGVGGIQSGAGHDDRGGKPARDPTRSFELQGDGGWAAAILPEDGAGPITNGAATTATRTVPGGSRGRGASAARSTGSEGHQTPA